MTDRSKSRLVDSYGAQYGNFDSELLAEVRREAFGEDIGQNGCRATGTDLHADAVSIATAYSKRRGLEDRTSFQVVNASEPLPFSSDKFDALICVDAINHLPDRISVLKEWHRVLKPGGRLLFTDPIIVTGPLTNHEIAIRASIGVFLFVPDGTDEQMLQMTGFSIERVADGTENMAQNARRWFDARARREAALREIEGGDAFDGQQVFFETAACLAEQRRLSRKAFLARKNS